MIPILPDLDTDLDLQRLALKARVAATLPEALLINNPDGLVWWINPAFEELTGYRAGELEGRTAWKALGVQETDGKETPDGRPSGDGKSEYRVVRTIFRKDGSPSGSRSAEIL